MELAAQYHTRNLSCFFWHKAELLMYMKAFKWAFFFFFWMRACLVQVTSFSQNLVSFFCKGNWPHLGRYWPLSTVFYPWQLNVIDSSGLWKFSSWWTFILYSGRTFPDTKISFGLLSDSFSITVTLSQIKLKPGEVTRLNTLVLV